MRNSVPSRSFKKYLECLEVRSQKNTPGHVVAVVVVVVVVVLVVVLVVVVVVVCGCGCGCCVKFLLRKLAQIFF